MRIKYVEEILYLSDIQDLINRGSSAIPADRSKEAREWLDKVVKECKNYKLRTIKYKVKKLDGKTIEKVRVQ